MHPRPPNKPTGNQDSSPALSRLATLPDRLKEHLGPGRLQSLPSGPRCLEQAVQTDGARGGGLLKETAKDQELADTGAWGLGGKRDPSSISPAWSKEPNLTR